MRIKILDQLARRRVFTVKEAAKVSGVDKNVLKVLLSRLEKKGWIERIEKGKYMVIPLGARKGKYTLNEFVIGSLLVNPSAISYWSALNHHGLTEQIPTTVFVQTTSRKKRQKLEIFGVRYKIIKIKERKFFGIENTWIDEFQVNVTDREKTIIDCLDKPEHCGGVIEVAKALKHGEFDFKKLSEYAVKIGNSGVIRRLGYLCDVLDLKIRLQKTKARNYLLLDPTMPEKGKTSSKWKLIINLDIGELE
ncbi:MAG: type IV toxin-antitoxin system AbiEi family antitoxin domain-containing protein [Candidatus Freyarchaeota archaeon]|nr:type IV toxin-antitoxin system AbiEi family antitoxin domain-containing protein [Candidatus Sigynarchaeota archaeon]